MKITIAGSMVFAKEMITVKEQLEKMDNQVLVTDNINQYVADDSIKSSFEQELELSIKHDVMRSFFNKIAESDALLVINHKKKNINGYLGASVLMEIGLAYHLNKKIFLWNPVDQEQSYALELAIINPIILEGDLSKIK